VDCQAGVGLVGSVSGGGAQLARQYHSNLETSIANHFPGNHAINCMCHSTENIYQMRDTALIRASDDFYPREAASSNPHVAACAYNSLFLSQICQPDWDMFQSLHPAARLHACARAVSGGAVYVSDKPGKHDFDVLRTLVLRDGGILRAQQPGLPTADCVFADPLRDNTTALKVRTSLHGCRDILRHLTLFCMLNHQLVRCGASSTHRCSAVP
jgi:raffinose synthase